MRDGETSRERTRQIGLWDSATIRFSLSAPQSAPFLFSPSLPLSFSVRGRRSCILGIHSGVLAERFSLVTRFVAVVIFDEIRRRDRFDALGETNGQMLLTGSAKTLFVRYRYTLLTYLKIVRLCTLRNLQ